MLQDARRMFGPTTAPTLVREALGLAGALRRRSSSRCTCRSSPDRALLPARGARPRILPVRLTCRLPDAPPLVAAARRSDHFVMPAPVASEAGRSGSRSDPAGIDVGGGQIVSPASLRRPRAPRRRRRASRPRRAGSRRGGSCSRAPAAAPRAPRTARPGAGPPAFSMAASASRAAGDLVAAGADHVARASTEAEAWPSAQAFTSWPKAAIAAVLEAEIDGDGRAAERRAPAGADLRLRQPLGQRDVGGERQDALRVELDQVVVAAHRRSLCFRLEPPIDRPRTRAGKGRPRHARLRHREPALRRPRPDPGDRPGARRRGADARLDERREPRRDARDRRRSPTGRARGASSGARARPRGTSSGWSSSGSTATATACSLIVEQTGPACHTDRPSCFFTAVRDGEEVVLSEPVA